MRSVDPELLRSAEHVQRNHVVWDIGANVGLFTFSAASRTGLGGLVIAVEPDLMMASLLKRSAASQPVQIVPVAVGNTVGPRTFHIGQRSRSANYLEGYGSTQAGGDAETREVLTVTLDWLAERFPLPDVIKIDVEGAEAEVLEGCSFLRTKRPLLIMEVCDEAADAVTKILKANDYLLTDGYNQVDRATWQTIAYGFAGKVNLPGLAAAAGAAAVSASFTLSK